MMATGSTLLASVRSCSLNCALFAERLSVLEHTHFFPTEASVLDCHAEEHIFVLLVIGGKGVLVKQNKFCVFRAGFREFGKLRSDGRDQAGLSLHAFVVGH
jgi:hypothetical protein